MGDKDFLDYIKGDPIIDELLSEVYPVISKDLLEDLFDLNDVRLSIVFVKFSCLHQLRKKTTGKDLDEVNEIINRTKDFVLGLQKEGATPRKILEELLNYPFN